MAMLRQRGTSLTIQDDEYECTVLFLWNKKVSNKVETGGDDAGVADEADDAPPQYE